MLITKQYSAWDPVRRNLVEAAQVTLEQSVQDARTNISRLVPGLTAAISKVDELVGMLHEDYIDDLPQPGADTQGWRDAVEAARRTTPRLSMLRRAAQHRMSQLSNPVLKAFVDAWIKCIQAYLYQSTLRGIARDALADARLESRNRYFEQFINAYVQNQVDQGVIQEAERQITYQNALQWLRDQIRTDPDQALDPDVVTAVINDLGTGTIPPWNPANWANTNWANVF